MESTRLNSGVGPQLLSLLTAGAALTTLACSGEAVNPGTLTTAEFPSGTAGMANSDEQMTPGAGDALPADGGGGVTPALGEPTVGTGLIRRLTRAEYNYTVRDLLGTTATPADNFPTESGSRDGFRNFADSQFDGKDHGFAYEEAAGELVEAALTDPAQRQRLVTCDVAIGDACIRELLEAFVPRAWRRPAQAGEVDRLMLLAATEAARGGSPEEQLKLALRGVLGAPYFLFRVEVDEDPTSVVPHRVNGYELASRLSYFLWSSMPDDGLFAAAAAGSLQDDELLAAEVERMLNSPKTEALGNVFAAEWLYLDRVRSAMPSVDLFPMVNDAIKLAMAEETKLFFKELLTNNGVLGTFVGADYTFANAELAAHYGLRAPDGPGFEKVSVVGTSHIGGLLGHGSILLPSSTATETAPFRRGAWIMANVLCQELPRAPNDVVAEFMDVDPNKTLRERLEAHRANPACAACHSIIDPIGLGLESFDPVGRFRETDRGKPVDSSGRLPDPGGADFANTAEMLDLLTKDPRVPDCIQKKLFTYAMARSPGPGDQAQLDAMGAESDLGLRTLVKNLVMSEGFRSRRGEALDAAPLMAPSMENGQ